MNQKRVSQSTGTVENFSYNTRRPVLLRINGVRPEVETYESDTDNLVARIQHFREAESNTDNT